MPDATVDACGCVAGEGWSSGDRACQPEKATNNHEAVNCALHLGYPSLTTDCDCVGGWTGAICDQPRREALDACGCELGSGWSKSSLACTAGATTTAVEAQDCASDTVAAPCMSDEAVASMNSNCPSKSAGRMTPDSCPAACMTAYLAWWGRCRRDPNLLALDRQSGNAFSSFAQLCEDQHGQGH